MGSPDWPQLLRLGDSLLSLQLPHPSPGSRLVDQIHHDPVCSTGFELSICARGGLLRIRVPWLDGWVQMVGHRSLQAGTHEK
jgi:hypothetical protein